MMCRAGRGGPPRESPGFRTCAGVDPPEDPTFDPEEGRPGGEDRRHAARGGSRAGGQGRAFVFLEVGRGATGGSRGRFWNARPRRSGRDEGVFFSSGSRGGGGRRRGCRRPVRGRGRRRACRARLLRNADFSGSENTRNRGSPWGRRGGMEEVKGEPPARNGEEHPRPCGREPRRRTERGGARDRAHGGDRFGRVPGGEIPQHVVEEAHDQTLRRRARHPVGRRLSVSWTAARTWAGVTLLAPAP